MEGASSRAGRGWLSTWGFGGPERRPSVRSSRGTPRGPAADGRKSASSVACDSPACLIPLPLSPLGHRGPASEVQVLLERSRSLPARLTHLGKAATVRHLFFQGGGCPVLQRGPPRPIPPSPLCPACLIPALLACWVLHSGRPDLPKSLGQRYRYNLTLSR